MNKQNNEGPQRFPRHFHPCILRSISNPPPRISPPPAPPNFPPLRKVIDAILSAQALGATQLPVLNNALMSAATKEVKRQPFARSEPPPRKSELRSTNSYTVKT